MWRSAQSFLARLVQETSGTEIAEAAAVLPLLFMVILSIFWFGQAFSQFGTITRAAQDGARAGATPSCSTCAAGNTPAQNAVNAVQASLAAAHLDINLATLPVPTPPLNACNGGGAPTCDGSSTHVCVQSPVELSSTVPGGSGVCGISVSFNYPFQFFLPFTSLNQKSINLRASARVRLENQ